MDRLVRQFGKKINKKIPGKSIILIYVALGLFDLHERQRKGLHFFPNRFDFDIPLSFYFCCQIKKSVWISLCICILIKSRTEHPQSQNRDRSC